MHFARHLFSSPAKLSELHRLRDAASGSSVPSGAPAHGTCVVTKTEGRDLTQLDHLIMQVGSGKYRSKMGSGGSQVHVPLLKVGRHADGSFVSPTGKKEARMSLCRLWEMRLPKRGQI